MNVLLAVDLRSDAAEVVHRALPWLERFRAVADLVFVDGYRAMLETWTPPAFRSELNRLVEEEEAQIQALLALIPDANRGRAILDRTSLEEMLEKRAKDYPLVMVGTRGRQGLAHLWAGSVAERVVRFCSTSVLVLRDHVVPVPLRLLFAVDLEEDPNRLAQALAPLAKRLEGTVDLLTVDEPPMIAPTLDAPVLYELLASYTEESRAAKARRLEELSAAFPAAVRGQVFVETGRPVDGIVLHSASADLVVVGTHGRSGVSHALVGSVAERVVRRAACPVLVLRPG